MLEGMFKLRFLPLLACMAVPLHAQDAPSATPPTATVYFYRLREAYAALLKPSVFVDGKQVMRMRNGRFAEMSFPVGHHTVTSNFPGSGLEIDMKPGETYYVRLGMTRPAMFHTSKGEITQVMEGQGKFEVSQLKQAEPEDTHPDGETQK